MIQNFFCRFSKKNLKFKLTNKFCYKNSKEFPHVKKIILTFNQKAMDFSKTTVGLLALEMISGQKGLVLKSKKTNLNLKLKKNNPLGSKVLLRKKALNFFAFKIFLNIFINNKKKAFIKTLNHNAIAFQNDNNFDFAELEANFTIFQKLSALNIAYTTNAKTKNEAKFLLSFLKIHLL